MNQRLLGAKIEPDEYSAVKRQNHNINPTNLQLGKALNPVPNITEEMIIDAKRKGGKCFNIIDDNYILIKDGEMLVQGIDKTKRLREKGINYCGPISYKEYDGEYYFIEYRAPGLKLDFYDYDDIKFNESFNKYFSYLELLSNAPQEQYNKFFDDIEAMKKESLKPDCCSLGNLFYDEKIGFSFIDVYPCNIRTGDSRLSVSEIFTVILNPKFSYKGLNIIPKEELSKYNGVIEIIYDKIILGLKSHGYSVDEIKKFLEKKKHVFSDKECVSYKDIEKYIEEHYSHLRMIIQL